MTSLLLTLLRFLGGVRLAWSRPDFRSILLLVVLTLTSGTIFFRTVEGWNWIDAFHFSVTTMSTIGSPGQAPQSDFGKLFTTLYIVVAVGLFVALIAFLAEGMVANSRALRDKTSNAGSNRSQQPD